MELKHVNDIEIISEVPENATVLGVVDGSVKRMPSGELGGQQDNNSMLVITYNRTNGQRSANMPLNEAIQKINNGEIALAAYHMLGGYDDDYEGNVGGQVRIMNAKVYDTGEIDIAPGAYIEFTDISGGDFLYYSDDGISYDDPNYEGDEDGGGE